jgi:hypothetical protein
MRYSLLDLLILFVSIAIGGIMGHVLAPFLPAGLRPVGKVIVAILVYLGVVYPVYRGFKLFPMVLPRCPCCNQFQKGFHFIHAWPRVTYRCPTCNGEFVIWHNGKIMSEETWDKPVLALKWPYAFGRYKRMAKPEADRRK